MSGRVRSAVVLAAAVVGIVAAACSGAPRPVVRDEASRPRSCADAAARAFPGGRRGTLPAYREVERRCSSLGEVAEHKAFIGSVLRIDCAPADVLALGAEIPELGPRVPSAPADLATTPVCRQFNAECADYDELRRDHAAVVRTPTLANLGLYVHHRALFEGCLHRYSGGS
jgi:hypothetical protein